MDNDTEIDRANRAKRGSPFLNTDQAAAYLKISAKSLKRLRRAGAGPEFRRHGHLVQYHIDDLDRWSLGSVPREGRR
ncbi:MAG: helix-turn-helix domain-containing protein [Novosphingobium sp.]|nr:helix-turn-helix domain-containing protein [Novosphingobium sp.]